MKHIILSVFLSSFLTGFTQQTKSSGTIFNDSTFAILQIDTNDYCSHKLITYSQDTFNSSVDLPLIDSLLRIFIAERTNPGKPFHCGQEIHDYDYYYQFIAIKNDQGEQIIWVNAFCPSILKMGSYPLTKREKRLQKKGKLSLEPDEDWQKHIVCAFDGCGCFWEVKIDLTKKTVFDTYISGI